MKKIAFKTMVAAVCVVAAGMSGMKAYKAGNQSEASMLLAENVEALSQIEYSCPCIPVQAPVHCYYQVKCADGKIYPADMYPAIKAN